eukprot:TRINITY_DN2025_c0_g1_i4.p1 TRINITY_DN2025_c0_g1~~TRINITY_DN2025_c0_g1_i4.p1  ORF type:complete len:245 (-),score=70.20 TRINITY_DN2025_c0_g1_i4:335-1069(-)
MLRSLVGSEMCIRDSINAEYGVEKARAMLHLERELAAARRLNQNMHVPSYKPLRTSIPAMSDPEFDPYQLGNESLRHYLLAQGVSMAVLDPKHGRGGLLDQLRQLGVEPKEDLSEPLSPRLRRQISDQNDFMISLPASPPPAPALRRGPNLTLWHRVHNSDDFSLTMAEPVYQQERENYCASYVSADQRASRERRIRRKAEFMDKRMERIEAGAQMIRRVESGQCTSPSLRSSFIPNWGKVRFQ